MEQEVLLNIGNPDKLKSILVSKRVNEDVILSEFIFALLLTVLPIPYLQAQSLRLLNTTLIAAFADCRLISESAFLRGFCDVPDDPAALIFRISQQCLSASGKHLTQGLVLLGFGLLRASAHSPGSALLTSRRTRATSAVKSHKPNTSPFVPQHHINVRVGRLAMEVLVHLFKVSSPRPIEPVRDWVAGFRYTKNCPQMRQSIMDILANILWAESSSPIALKLADLLADMGAASPLDVAVLADRLEPVINSIGLIPVELSIGLVHALLPLIRAGNQLVDAWNNSQQPTENPMGAIRTRLFTTLCKAASSPRVHYRRTAVACFLILLKHLKASPSNGVLVYLMTVSVSAFRSASQNSSGNLSQGTPFTQTQATQLNPHLLYSQLQSTQLAQQAVVLPCDVDQNEALCTEIVSVLHRIIFSAFFRSQAGSLLEDPENRVKSDIYWGLCEVVTRNKGLCEPVLNMYLRLLLASLSPSFLREIKRTQPLASLTVPTMVESSQPALGPSGPPVHLDDLITTHGNTGTEVRRTEHPDILVWCLQSVLTLPQFVLSWRQYRLKRAQARASSANESGEESSESASMGFSQFTQSTVTGSVACGRAVSTSLFSKAVTLLLSLSDSLRLTPLDDFGLNPDTDFGNTSAGTLNRERANLLLGLYDACLELELKDPLELISASGSQQTQSGNQAESSWSRIRQLFARRVALSTLLCNKTSSSSSQASAGSLLLPTFGQGTHFRPGLLILGLTSASQSGLSRVLRASSTSDAANSLAYHMLLTISTRLSQFTHCAGGGIPYAYRDLLVQAIASILRHVIRYYNHKLLVDLDPSTTPSASTATANTSALSIGVSDSDPANTAKARSSSPTATYSAALSVLDVAFTLAMDYLGSKRLHRLAVRIYSTTSDPGYRYPQFEQHAASEFAGEGEEDNEDDNLERRNTDVTPAQALSAVIKLIKGWITKLLNPNSGTSFVSTQRVSSQAVAHTRDLVVLIPLLVRLCRARATIGSDESSRTANIVGNMYGGLDRVLAWLIRLMRSAAPQSSSKPGSEAVGLLTAARVQLVSQTVWLAHLVEAFSNEASQGSDSQLNLDYLLTTIAADIHHTLKDASVAQQDTSYLPDDSEGTVTFPMVTRVSALPLLNLLYSTVRQLVSEFEWLLAHLAPSLGGRMVADNSKMDELRAEGNSREEALCTRLSTVGETLSELLKTAVPAPSAHADNLLEVSARIFNFLTQFVKYHAESEKLKGIQDKQPLKKTEKNGQKSGASLKKTLQPTGIPQTVMSRSIKDSRVIPQLVFSIEQYERFLMQLSKLSKVNLMRNVKLAVSRDFRINTATVAAQLERSALLSPSSDSDVEVQDENIGPANENSIAPVAATEADNSNQSSTDCPPMSVVDLILPDSGGSQNQLPSSSTQNETITPKWGRQYAVKRSMVHSRPCISVYSQVSLSEEAYTHTWSSGLSQFLDLQDRTILDDVAD
ncbi:herpesvirus phosphoprotein 85, partial [Opisthorchis viverrini]